MMMNAQLHKLDSFRFFAFVGSLLLVSCGGGSSDNSPLPPPSDENAVPTMELVSDINSGAGPSIGSNPFSPALLNGAVYFVAEDDDHGRELWRTNADASEAELALDLWPGPQSAAPGSLTPFGGRLYFVADDGVHGRELWVTDGTDIGTRLVIDLNPGAESASPWIYLAGNTLYLRADDGTQRGLWKSDGTAQGTEFLRSFVTLSDVTALDQHILFCAGDSYADLELWKSDGTPQGTVLVKDIHIERSSSPSSLTLLNGEVLFTASHPDVGRELWKSDGTEEGTTLLKDIRQGSSNSHPNQLIPFRNRVVFQARDSQHGGEIWISDGTEEGTVLLKDCREGTSGSFPQGFTPLGSTLYFEAGGSLWQSSGSEETTFEIETHISYPVAFMVADQKLYFTASSEGQGSELWFFDPTDAAVRLVKDIVPGQGHSVPRCLASFGDRIVFTADDRIHGRELWSTSGTASSTKSLDIRETRQGAYVESLTQVGDTIYFTAFESEFGRELYMSDGTEEGTKRVIDLSPGTESTRFRDMIAFKGELFFVAEALEFGFELWKTDGTEEGTMLLRDIAPEYRSSNPFDLTVMGDHLFFGAENDEFGTELYRTDGSVFGTVLVKDIAQDGIDGIYEGLFNPVVFEDKLYFGAIHESFGFEIWESDGTDLGTKVLGDRQPGTDPTYFKSPVVAGGKLYFIGYDPDLGHELWTSDGTLSGTNLVLDVRVGPESGVRSDDDVITVTESGQMYFLADDGLNGIELWTSDGTPSGTKLVKDIEPGPSSSQTTSQSSSRMVSSGDRVFFSAICSQYGHELWVSDGTESGTHLVSDIVPGGGSSSPQGLANSDLSERILFTAFDKTHGAELWMTDGTPEGTEMVADYFLGEIGSNPKETIQWGESFVASGKSAQAGRELVIIRL